MAGKVFSDRTTRLANQRTTHRHGLHGVPRTKGIHANKEVLSEIARNPSSRQVTRFQPAERVRFHTGRDRAKHDFPRSQNEIEYDQHTTREYTSRARCSAVVMTHGRARTRAMTHGFLTCCSFVATQRVLSNCQAAHRITHLWCSRSNLWFTDDVVHQGGSHAGSFSDEKFKFPLHFLARKKKKSTTWHIDVRFAHHIATHRTHARVARCRSSTRSSPAAPPCWRSTPATAGTSPR